MSDESRPERAARKGRRCGFGRSLFVLVVGLTAGFVAGNLAPVNLRELASKYAAVPVVPSAKAKLDLKDPKVLLAKLEQTERELRTKLELIEVERQNARRSLKLGADRGEAYVSAKEAELAALDKKAETIEARLSEVSAARLRLKDSLKSEEDALKIDNAEIDEIIIRSELKTGDR